MFTHLQILPNLGQDLHQNVLMSFFYRCNLDLGEIILCIFYGTCEKEEYFWVCYEVI
jgi:hypothetical protein